MAEIQHSCGFRPFSKTQHITHITCAPRTPSIPDHFHRGLIRLGNRVFQQPFFQAGIHWRQVSLTAPNDPSRHDLPGDIDSISAEFLPGPVQRQRVYIFGVHNRRSQRRGQYTVPQKIPWTVSP